MIELVNNMRQPVSLADGVILAAADTKGSARKVESLSESDRQRLVDTGRVTILREVIEQSTQASAGEPGAPVGADAAQIATMGRNKEKK